MANGNGSSNVIPKPWWVAFAQTFGFASVACIALAAAYNKAMDFERGEMLPTIKECAKAMQSNAMATERNTGALNANAEVMRDVQETLKSAHQSK